MTGRSILYLGGSEYAAEFIDNLKSSATCRYFGRSPSMALRDIPDWVELILFEVGPAIAQSGQTLAGLIQTLSAYPLVAVTTAEQEHRGIAAVAAGAQGYDHRDQDFN